MIWENFDNVERRIFLMLPNLWVFSILYIKFFLEKTFDKKIKSIFNLLINKANNIAQPFPTVFNENCIYYVFYVVVSDISRKAELGRVVR